jgi:hypothetical protein
MDFQIKPLAIPKYATRMKIEANIILGEKAFIVVSFYEEGSEFTPLEVKRIMLEGNAYKNWGSDDNYIKNLVLQYLRTEKLEVIIT